MTTAQIVFSIALGVVALIITAFAVYVISSTMWANRWVKATVKPRLPEGESKVD